MQESMPLRWKVVLLSIVPLILVGGIAFALVFTQAARLAQDEIQILRNNVIESQKQGLTELIELALATVEPIYNDDSLREEEAQEQVITLLSRMTYGEDGYFFVYTWDGDNLVLPYQPHMVGQNLWHVEDTNGTKLLQELIAAGRRGGDYVHYYWHKPSVETPVQKISYAVSLDRWQWMIGTGVYVDDIEVQIAQIEHEFDERIKQTAALLCVIVVVSISVIAFLGASINFSDRREADSKLAQLNQRIIESQEDERQRVARELHDGINQLLASVKFSLEQYQQSIAAHYSPNARMRSQASPTAEKTPTAERQVSNALEQVTAISSQSAGDEGLTSAHVSQPQPQPQAQGIIKPPDVTPLLKAQRTIDGVISEVRRISHALRPSVLDDLGLVAALDSLVTDIEARTGIALLFEHDIDDLVLVKNVDTTLYRVAQEALTNIEKHAKASAVDLVIQQEGDELLMTIADDGIGLAGFSASKRLGRGLGLKNMRQRVEHLGGFFRLRSSAEDGTEVRVSIPLKNLS
uniref:cache domain-containing protein n=1 Tax=Thaumasiovibrio occultus TaxID=1891184 RepID=UPI00131D2B26|nr:cache domain-containing protein [Thaumasiovibrio occultus]